MSDSNFVLFILGGNYVVHPIEDKICKFVSTFSFYRLLYAHEISASLVTVITAK